MQNTIERALARIRRADGKTAGAGWLIAPAQAVTCAHVVNAALGRDLACTEAPPPDTRLTLDLPNLTPARASVQAGVLHWLPPSDSARPEDIAVLGLDDPVIPLERPATLPPAQAPTPGEQALAYGFPARADDGLVATARISGSPDGLLQLDSLGRPEIEPGFSGGPVIDAEGRVIGMTVQRNTSHAIARAIPVGLLEQVWHGLAALRTDAAPGLTLHLAGGAPLIIDTPYGRREADPQQLAANGRPDPVALHRALFADTAERDAMLHPPARDGRPRRLCLVVDGSAAGLPWHGLASAPGQPLGDAGWIIECVRDPRPATAPRALRQVLMLAPGDQALAPGAVSHVSRMAAQLRRLMENPDATVDRAHDAADLRASLERDPDLVYCYARLAPQGRLILGQDEQSREELALTALIERLARLQPPPLLWLHCIEGSTAGVDVPALFAQTAHLPLVWLQRSHKRNSADARARACDWIDRLAAGADPALEPAAALSRLPDADSLCWQARSALRLTPAKDPDARLRAEIRAALIRLRLGRHTHKALINRAVEDAADGDLRLYAVGGEPDACPHELPDQARYDLETRREPHATPYRVELHWLPLMLTPDQDLEEDLADVLELHLEIGRLACREALARRMVEPLPNERVVISLAWLMQAAPDLSADDLAEALADWRRLMVETFPRGHIPDRCLVVAGACVQWPADWPRRQQTDAAGLRGLLDHALQDTADEPGAANADWVPDLPALDLLNRQDLSRFFGDFARRVDSPVQGLPPGKLADWCLAECAGRFEDTVTLIYRGCRDGFPPLD
jgi:hypothetical protein